MYACFFSHIFLSTTSLLNKDVYINIASGNVCNVYV